MPPTTTSWPPSIINDIPLDNPLLLIPIIPRPPPLRTFPLLALALLPLDPQTLALDLADPVLALAPDLFAQLDELQDVFLGGC